MLPLSLGVSLGIISIIGLLVNTYILLVVLSTKQVSANNILLLHLGIINSLLCIQFLIFSLPSIANETTGVATIDILCQFHGFLLQALHPVVLWTICGLNCDRYYAIASPLHYGAIVNTRKVSYGLLCGWIIALLLSIPPLFGVAPFHYDSSLGACVPNYLLTDTLWYGTTVTIVTYIIPGILIIGCNIRVLMIARYHRHRIASAIYEVTLSAQVTITHQRNPFFIPMSGQKLRNRSPVSSVLELIGSFLLLYCPYYVTILWNSSIASLQTGNTPRSLATVPSSVRIMAAICLTCAAPINGVLYGIKNKVMRKTFQNYLRKKKTKIEINNEIQARTPSTCGSRRPSLSAFGMLTSGSLTGGGLRSMPHRRLSETLLDIDHRSERPMKRIASELSWQRFNEDGLQINPLIGERGNITGRKNTVTHSSSCNTLQIPGGHADPSFDSPPDLYLNLKNSLRSALKNGTTGPVQCNGHGLNGTDSNITVDTAILSSGGSSTTSTQQHYTGLLNKVLRIDTDTSNKRLSFHEPATPTINYYDRSPIRSPRILITRAYSDDSEHQTPPLSLQSPAKSVNGGRKNIRNKTNRWPNISSSTNNIQFEPKWKQNPSLSIFHRRRINNSIKSSLSLNRTGRDTVPIDTNEFDRTVTDDDDDEMEPLNGTTTILNTKKLPNNVHSEYPYYPLTSPYRKFSSLDEQTNYGLGSDSEMGTEEQQLLLSWPITRKKYIHRTMQTLPDDGRNCDEDGQTGIGSKHFKMNPLYNDRCEEPEMIL